MQIPLIGNQRTGQILASMIENKRLPHAILIDGEDGLGKRTLARFLAKAYLCGEVNAPCLTCKGCHLVDVGSHPDLMYIGTEAGNIKVDEIRTVRNEAYLAPAYANGRVFILTNAHTMNASAQNALLKVLEEPPAGACFILLARNAMALLPTVRSRCVCFTLSPVALEQPGFARVVELTGKSLPEAELLLIRSDGNIGQAVLLAESETNLLTGSAAEILSAAGSGNCFVVLQQLQPFAKNRAQLPDLLASLKNAVFMEMHKKTVETGSVFTAQKLDTVYSGLSELEAAIIFNPPMGLVLCRIASILCD